MIFVRTTRTTTTIPSKIQVALYEAQRVTMVNWDTDSEDPSSDEEMENSFASKMSSDFGDIFQYERDLSYDAHQCSTPVATPFLDERKIFLAARNDSICLAKGDKGPNAWMVDSHYSFDSYNGQPYYVEGCINYPTKNRTTTTTSPSSKSLTAMQDPLP